MSCYIVSFETADAVSKAHVVERLKSYSAYCPINEYCWAIKTDTKPKEIAEFVGDLLKVNERIFVVRSGTEAAWKNSFGEKFDEWLKNNL